MFFDRDAQPLRTRIPTTIKKAILSFIGIS
jgi:hypothetical protein